MVPSPPHISHAVSHWRDGELFWIVNHGIKMTAMPAWPARHRDDEVWEMVAFLRQIPELSPAGYRRAVNRVADADGPLVLQPLLDRCARCHGSDGVGPSGTRVPVIAGLNAAYLRDSLEAYRQGHRASGFMQAQVTGLSGAQIDALAEHFAGRSTPLAETPRPPSPPLSAKAEAGRRIALEGVRERQVPACAACHGPAEYERAESYPALAGQRAGYLKTQLELFRQGRRGGARFSPLMTFAARNLTDGDIEALAAYYDALGAGER